MNITNAKRQGGFFAIGLAFGLIALATAAGFTVNAAVSEGEETAAAEQQVQVAAGPAQTGESSR